MTEWGSAADLDFRDRNMSRSGSDTEPNGPYYQGIAFERERILQIISWLFPGRPNEPIENLIEEIKGEQK